MKIRTRARFYAIQALYENILTDKSFNELKIKFFNDNHKRSEIDWDFFYYLMDNIAINFEFINSEIKKVTDYDLINNVDLAILRLGVLELKEKFEIPKEIIISEYINQAKILGNPKSLKFVNAILDKIANKIRKNYSNE